MLGFVQYGSVAAVDIDSVASGRIHGEKVVIDKPDIYRVYQLKFRFGAITAKAKPGSASYIPELKGSLIMRAFPIFSSRGDGTFNILQIDNPCRFLLQAEDMENAFLPIPTGG